MKSLAAVCLAVLMSGCALNMRTVPPSPDSWGPEPEGPWQASFKSTVAYDLGDPDSTLFRFGCPVKGYVKHRWPSTREGFAFVGYLARLDFNAKNSRGGYDGYQSVIAMITPEGTLQGTIEPMGGGWVDPTIFIVEWRDCAVPVAARAVP